jgi:Uma2 family endonuclease
MYFTAERFASINRQTQIRTLPDLVIEVLSPSTEDYDQRTKLRTYAALGIPHYWIVDARNHLVTENVLQPNGRYQERVVGPDGIFRPALFSDLEIDLARTLR